MPWAEGIRRSRPALLYGSIRHSRPQQIYHRVRLTGLRRYREWRGPGAGFGDSPPSPCLSLPRSPFLAIEAPLRSPRSVPHLDILGLDVPWRPALEWRPVGDEWTQLRRFHLHYMDWLAPLSDDQVATSIRSWIGANPPYGRRYWHDAWSSYVISLRVVAWLQQIAARPDLNREAVGRALFSVVGQVRVLAEHLELDLGGNHLVKNALALLWAAACFEGEEADAWKRTGEGLLRDVLDHQILGDGVHYERSASYHAQVLADLIQCSVVVGTSSLRRRVGEDISRMASALSDLTHPDDGPALFNDAGLSMAHSLEACRAAMRRAGLHALAPTDRPQVHRPEAGFFGWKHRDDLFLVRCGPSAPDELPAHGHADALSFEWSLSGLRFFVDAGVGEYEAGERRTWSRSTAAHNTVTVDGQDQSELWSSFRCARPARSGLRRWETRRDGFVLEGMHDGYTRLPGRPVHRRRVEFGVDRLRISDQVSGGEGQPVAAGLLLHPEVEVSVSGRRVTLRRAGVVVVLDVSGDVRVLEREWMPDLGRFVRTRQINVDYGRAPIGGTLEFSVRARPGQQGGDGW